MRAVINRTVHPINNPREDLLEESSSDNDLEYPRSPIIQINLYGFNFMALIDTGSEISCISDEVWGQLEPFYKIIPTFPCTGVTVMGAFKIKQRRVKQQSLLTFSIAKNEFCYEFLLIPDLVFPIIIGIDFLRTIPTKLDLENNCVFFKICDKWCEIPEVRPGKEYDTAESFNIKRLNVKNISLPMDDSFDNTLESDIAHLVKHSCLSADQQKIFHSVLIKYQSLFSDIPGRTREYHHQIRLKDNREFCLKQYPIPLAHREAIQKQLDTMEKWGVIRQMATPYISPIVATLKKDNSVRICLDARYLNSLMEKEHNTPPPIEEIMRTVKNIKYMSSCDFSCGYWQIPLTPDSQKYTGFKFHGKTYCFCTLPFGLSTSVSTFSRCLSSIFGSEFDSFLVIYVDDLLIMSTSFEEHMHHIEKVFNRLKEAGFTLRLKKCSFFREEMPFLGYILNSSGIRPDPSRTQALADYRPPKNVKELQRFLGLANFDRSFCQDFSALAAPLTYLLKKKTRWKWTATEQQAFDNLKQKLQENTLLYHPRDDVPYCLETDACDIALGCQLFQVIDGERRPVAWASRLLLSRETRYSINEKEALCTVWALSKFRIYLLSRKFTIYTDNSSVTYLKTCRLLSARIARYALAIQEFDFDIKHIPGTQNVIADALSRYAAVRPPSPHDKYFKILPTIKLPKSILQKVKDISRYQQNDPKLHDIRKQLASDSNLQKRFLLVNDILYLRHSNEEFYLLCIPKCLIEQLVESYHNTLGHFGSYKTWRSLKSEVWWNNMYKDIKRIIRNCEICQMTKCSALPNPELHSIIPNTKNELLALDIYGPLPVSRGGVSYVLVLLDVFSKYVTFYALKKATTRAILNRLTTDYFPKIGLVKNILSDHGTQFTSGKWKETLESLNIKVIYSSVRRPQANPSERVMRELGRLCRAYCHDHHRRWAWELQNFALFLNSLIHESTGYSPNELQLGIERIRLLPTAISGTLKHENQVSVESKLILARETLISKAARRNLRHPHRPFPEFQPGDQVLLKANTVSSAIKSETKKFLLLFEGPYKIKKRVSHATYVLQYLESDKERGTFHACHMKHFRQKESLDPGPDLQRFGVQDVPEP